MEAIDRSAMCVAIYPALQTLHAAGRLDATALDAAIAAAAEGYPFPTNLDTDPPQGGLAPKSQAEIMRDALTQGSDLDTVKAMLAALDERRRA